MNSELIGIISLLPRSLLHFNVDSKWSGGEEWDVCFYVYVCLRLSLHTGDAPLDIYIFGN